MTDSPRFAADEMLGSLARWLRIMGFDTLYCRDLSDDQIIEAVKREGRILLTRDYELAQRFPGTSLLVESDDLDHQLRQVSARFALLPDEDLARCTVCNGELNRVSPDDVKGDVPAGVQERNKEFFRCTRCFKVYWKGTHWQNIRKRFESIDDQTL